VCINSINCVFCHGVTDVACGVQMWEKVKATNPSMGVCEMSSTIGRLWRELGPEDKQRHNDEYTLDKVIVTMYNLCCNLRLTIFQMTDSAVKYVLSDIYLSLGRKNRNIVPLPLLLTPSWHLQLFLYPYLSSPS